MKIGLVLQCFDPARGGLEQWTYNFARGLIDRGHDVHIVAERFGPSADALPITMHPLDGAGRRFHFARASQARLMQISPDIIHDMGYGWYCDIFHPHVGSWYSLWQRRLELLSPIRRLLKRSFDEFSPRVRQLRDLVKRQYADRGQIMIALSEAIADDFRRLHDVPDQRIRVVRNGVDVDHFSPCDRIRRRVVVRRALGIDENETTALIVAQNLRLKGVPALLEATARLERKGRPIRLLVVGGRNIRGWRLKAWQMGVANRVDFVGMVDDPRPYYAAADYFVMPTLYDACSLVALEAAAAGLPVITSRCNGAAEMLRDGRDCLLLDRPTDIEELTSKMLILSDIEVRQRIAKAARETAENNTFKANVDRIIQIYQQVVDQRSGLAQSINRSADPMRKSQAVSRLFRAKATNQKIT